MNFQSRYVHLYSHLPDLKIVVKKKEEYIFIDISECTNEKIKWKKEDALFYKPTFKNGCRRKQHIWLSSNCKVFIPMKPRQKPCFGGVVYLKIFQLNVTTRMQKNLTLIQVVYRFELSSVESAGCRKKYLVFHQTNLVKEERQMGYS